MTTMVPFAFIEAAMDYVTQVTGIQHTCDKTIRFKTPKLIGNILISSSDYFSWTLDE